MTPAKLVTRFLCLMKYSSDMVHKTGLKWQAAHTLSRFLTKQTGDFGINNDIQIVSVATRAPKTLQSHQQYSKTYLYRDNRTTATKDWRVHESKTHSCIFPQYSTDHANIQDVLQFRQDQTPCETFTYRRPREKVVLQSRRPIIFHLALC